MQGHVSFSFSCENFAYLQVVSVKMTFQQINSTCGNCTYANFQKIFSHAETIWTRQVSASFCRQNPSEYWDTLGFRIAETC